MTLDTRITRLEDATRPRKREPEGSHQITIREALAEVKFCECELPLPLDGVRVRSWGDDGNFLGEFHACGFCFLPTRAGPPN